MFCAQCGQPVAEAMKFCPHCGTPVIVSATPAALAPRVADPATDPAPSAGRGPERPGGYGAGAAIDTGAATQSLFARVKGILLSPSTEWPVIAAESSSAGAIYVRYVAPLAAIGVIASFIGHAMIGYDAAPLGQAGLGIGAALVKYLFAFVGIWVVAWLVDLLAPTFGGQRDSLRSLKVAAYSYTPAWVAGIFTLIPALGALAVLAGLYGLYLLYIGLPMLMRTPADKSLGYTVVLILCAMAVSVTIAILSTCAITGLGLAGIGALGRLGHGGSAAPADAASAIAGIFGGKSDGDKARVADALSRLQKMGGDAQRGASPGVSSSKPATGADLTAALNALGTIASGGKNVQPVDFRRLKEMLPETLAGMKRSEATGQSGEAMGIKGSSATARYTDGAGASINVEITDLGSLSGLAGIASRFDPSMEKETDNGYERTSKVNGQIVHERYDRRAKSGEISIILGERFNVAVRGNGVETATLQGAIKEIDLAAIVALAK